MPGGNAWRGLTSIRFTSTSTGWALFTLGQGAASQEPYVPYGTRDGGRDWTPRLVTPGLWLVDMPQLDAPPGPGGYPEALAAYDSAAWAAVHSPASGHLEVVQLAADGAAPTAALGPQRPAVLRTGDGGATWATDQQGPEGRRANDSSMNRALQSVGG